MSYIRKTKKKHRSYNKKKHRSYNKKTHRSYNKKTHRSYNKKKQRLYNKKKHRSHKKQRGGTITFNVTDTLKTRNTLMPQPIVNFARAMEHSAHSFIDGWNGNVSLPGPYPTDQPHAVKPIDIMIPGNLTALNKQAINTVKQLFKP